MYIYVPEHIRCGDRIVSLITATPPFVSPASSPIPPHVLGTYGSKADADAAYDAWCDEVEGTGGHINVPWDNLEFRMLPCERHNVPALAEAARTGKPVYMTLFRPEQVLTEDDVNVMINAVAMCVTVTDRTGKRRSVSSDEASVLMHRSLTQVGEDVLQRLR
ncbi:hypothetical protein [Deinococcus aerophilus]|uniref:Uncharacterized protein n=1 Tax=Deinococcus aerophilus TaxID=522488 RepID=A0ABQ2GYJ5_9DEIO|nr:hypothetical protein [Deinococcus aerophilus]GGM20243.1 hypothetical protein GCM10010841_30340 [Deinococcus aerophilus]